MREGLSISEEQVSGVFNQFRKFEQEDEVTKKSKAVEAISSLLPSITQEEYDLKQKELKETGERKALARGVELEKYPYLEASEKKEFEIVDPEYFILLRQLVTGDYKEKLRDPEYTQYARELHVRNWAERIYKEDGSYDLSVFDEEGILVRTSTFEKEIKEIPDVAQRKSHFVNKILKEQSFWLNQGDKIRLTPEEYEQVVSKIIWDEIQLRRERDTLPYFAHINLSFGLEIEVCRMDVKHSKYSNLANRVQQRELDTLQDLGIPVGYDAIRELEIPKSLTSRDQLRVVLELVKSGFIKPNQDLSIQINSKGAEFDENFFFIDQVLLASDVYQYNQDNNGVYVPKDCYKRLLHEDSDKHSNDFRSGFPFRVKPDGVIEYREISVGGMEWTKFIKTIETYACLAEALCAYQKINNGESESPYDRKLAQIYAEFVESASGLIKSETSKKEYQYLLSGKEFLEPMQDFQTEEEINGNRLILSRFSLKDIAMRDGMREILRHVRVGVRKACEERK